VPSVLSLGQVLTQRMINEAQTWNRPAALSAILNVVRTRSYPVALLALSLTFASCSSGADKQAAPSTTTAENPAGITASPRAPTTNVRPSVTTRLELQSEVVAPGHTIVGALVVDNETGKPIRTGACATWGVQLTNENVPVRRIPIPPPCAPGRVFPVGIDRYPVYLGALFLCGSVPPPGLSCRNELTPLPVGDYHAVLVQIAMRLPPPKPVSVRVVTRP
jgi:hypothetical protein